MAFTHGIYKQETPTSIIAPTEGETGLPVVIGTAPVFLADSPKVNEPVLCYSYSEAVKSFGFSENFSDFTLCEFIYSQFALYGQAPAILINVFDPEKHCEKISGKSFSALNNVVNLGQNVIKSSGISFDVSNNFSASYDDNGNCIITFEGSVSEVKASFSVAKPELVTSSDIIGGISATTGKSLGLELVENIFPKFRLVPGIIACPKFSCLPEVAAVMRAKCENINGIFSCICIVDIPSDASGAQTYSQAVEWKNSHNLNHERQLVCWPMVELGNRKFHMSTQLIGVINATDSDNDNVPFKSPSNELMMIDSVRTDSGNEISLGLEQANYLNSQGIITSINFINGFVAWGNRTACYPANSDVKDCFIPVRRMFDFLSNSFILTFWQNVDMPVTLRLIQTIINSFNIYLNGLAARQMLLGGRIEFRNDENPSTNLIDGKLIFHVFITPPVPAETIEAIFEYDPKYLNSLSLY